MPANALVAGNPAKVESMIEQKPRPCILNVMDKENIQSLEHAMGVLWFHAHALEQSMSAAVAHAAAQDSGKPELEELLFTCCPPPQQIMPTFLAHLDTVIPYPRELDMQQRREGARFLARKAGDVDVVFNWRAFADTLRALPQLADFQAAEDRALQAIGAHAENLPFDPDARSGICGAWDAYWTSVAPQGTVCVPFAEMLQHMLSAMDLAVTARVEALEKFAFDSPEEAGV